MAKPTASAEPTVEADLEFAEAHMSMLDIAADPATSFDVQVTAISGEAMTVEGLHPSDTLQVLRQRVAQNLGVPRGVVKLVFGSRVFDCACFAQSLQALSIGSGATLTLFKQRVLEVTKGMRIEVIGAGTDRVNGTYTCVRQEEKFISTGPADVQGRVVSRMGNTIAALYFQKDGGPEALSWFGAEKDSVWPAAWFMQIKNDHHGIYYLPSDEPDVLPMDCWEIYSAERWSKPGVGPMPTIDFAAVSSPE